MSGAPVSHGRGGTGNIGPDDGQYVDGGITRAGDPAASGAAYSTGRGGASNIASPKGTPTQAAVATDDDIVPDVAKVVTNDEVPHHAGRGGQGNVVPAPGKKPHKGLADRIKDKLFQILNRKKKVEAAATETAPAAAAEATATTEAVKTEEVKA